MPRVPSKGKCRLCGETLSKQAMTRHVSKCLNQHVAGKPSIRKPQHWLHLVIEGGSQYWLQVEVRGSAKLVELDGFLRDLWLECCGHLSAFRIEHKSYSMAPDDTGWSGQDEEDMQAPVERVLRPGMHAKYEYDFGSTTELQIKVVGERTGAALAKERVLLLARNDPPAIACGVCGAPATQVDTEQAWEGEGWLCDACAAKADTEMLLPVVNSPRTGVCGYTGSDLESV